MNGTYSRLLPLIGTAICLCFAVGWYDYADAPFSYRALRRAMHRPPRRIPDTSAQFTKPKPIERARAPPMLARQSRERESAMKA